MPYGWEGNRRSGVALAMRHRLKWFTHLRAHGLKREDEHPAYTHYVLLLDPCPFPLPKKIGEHASWLLSPGAEKPRYATEAIAAVKSCACAVWAPNHRRPFPVSLSRMVSRDGGCVAISSKIRVRKGVVSSSAITNIQLAIVRQRAKNLIKIALVAL